MVLKIWRGVFILLVVLLVSVLPGSATTALANTELPKMHKNLPSIGGPIKDSGTGSDKVTLLGCPQIPVVDIYSGPNQRLEVVDWLLQGTCVSFDARSLDGRWVRITADEKMVSKTGWVKAEGILLEEDITNLVEQDMLEVALAVTEVRACVNYVSTLSIRAGPSRAYDRLGHMKEGDCDQVLGVNEDRSWALTDRGWVSLYYMHVSGDITLAPIIHLPDQEEF